MALIKLLSIADYQIAAHNKLSKPVYDYISGAAFDEITAKQNQLSFNHIFITPRVLKKNSLDNLNPPLMIAPSAFHHLVHDDGEMASVKASSQLKIPHVVSVMSSHSLEEIAEKTCHKNLWLQLYLFKDKKRCLALIERAVNAGYKAVMISVGMPCHSKRYRDLKNNFTFGKEITPGNFKNMIFKNIQELTTKYLAQDFDWQDIAWLQENSPLPIYIKGILHPEDAEIACQMNCSGIVVSNHGGRQLDGAVPSIIALQSIAKVVNHRINVIFDSGIRRGSDIFKAYALGADMVMIGRPVLWALAINGEKSVIDMLNILIEDFKLTAKLAGCASMKDIRGAAKYFYMSNYLKMHDQSYTD